MSRFRYSRKIAVSLLTDMNKVYMNILVVGGGGREHALAWKLSQTPVAENVYVAPGNAGTDAEPGLENVAIAADDIDAQVAFAKTKKIDLTVIGPEQPLVAGIVDHFYDAGLRCFGPGAEAAELEGSKRFTKDFPQTQTIRLEQALLPVRG